MSDVCISLTTNVNVVAIDESMIGYKPSRESKERDSASGNAAPTVFLPRNPHPNGLLFYIAATKVDDHTQKKTLPWMLAIFPHLVPGDQSHAFSHLVSACKFPRVHFVTDSWFSTKENFESVKPPSTFTISCRANMHTKMWDALTHNLPVSMWRAAFNKNSVFASVHKCVDSGSGKTAVQRVLSNAWEYTCARGQPEQPSRLCESHCQDEPFPRIPFFTHEILAVKMASELREICGSWNIRFGTKKATAIEAILKRVGLEYRELSLIEQAKPDLEKSRLAGDGPIHETYKSCFNFVDMVDSRWYSVEEHHHYDRWQIKMILALMRFAVINSWTYHRNGTGEEWIQWRLAVASELINSTPEIFSEYSWSRIKATRIKGKIA